MKNIIKFSLLTILVFFLGACANTELEDLLNDPSAVTPENAELGLVYNNVILEFVEFVDEASDETMPYVRMVAMSTGNQYFNEDGPVNFDVLWEKAFSELLPDINLVVQLANETEPSQTIHSGSAKVMKAYILFTLVDLFGDIPYSQAFQGIENPSPGADDDQDVYEAAFTLLEEAIAELGAPRGTVDNDIYYNGSAARWLRLAKTLQLRYYVMTRLVNDNAASAINALLDEGNIIDQTIEDWEFQYGSNRVNPDSRHPYYTDGYEVGGPSWYMSNYYMWQFFGEKETEDPRLRYYFYRQDCDESDEDQFTLDCVNAPYPSHWPDGLPWCTASLSDGDPDDEYGGYWGRAHGNNDGIPPDDLLRTAWGLYPAGGKFDDNPQNCPDSDIDDDLDVSNMGTDGGRGAGIQPIMLSSWVYFLRAEAALILKTNDMDPRELLRTAVTQSIEKVMGFESVAPVNPDFKPSEEQVDAYIEEVLALYDAAATEEDKLDVIMNEYRLALHGNGLEAFNNYRRTGKPTDMQPTREVDSTPFPRTFWYPAGYVNRNANATQRQDLTTQVFWDTNPAQGFIN